MYLKYLGGTETDCGSREERCVKIEKRMSNIYPTLRVEWFWCYFEPRLFSLYISLPFQKTRQDRILNPLHIVDIK